MDMYKIISLRHVVKMNFPDWRMIGGELTFVRREEKKKLAN